MQIDSFYPPYSPSLASLQTVLARTRRELKVSWFGLICGADPAMTLGLNSADMPLSAWKVGQELILRVPLHEPGDPVAEVEFQCRLAEIRDWYGKVMLRAQLLKADGPGKHLVGRALNQLCQGTSWRKLFL